MGQDQNGGNLSQICYVAIPTHDGVIFVESGSYLKLDI